MIPSIPQVPKVPMIQKVPINQNKFKLLNLKEISLKNTSNSVFNFDSEIKLEDDLTCLFKIIEQIPKKECTETVLPTVKKQENVALSSMIDKNKFAAIYVSIRKLNSIVKFNSFVENAHIAFNEEFSDSDLPYDEILDILLSQDLLITIFSLIPSDIELKLISNVLSTGTIEKSIGEAEKWILKCCEFPELKSLIELLMTMFKIKETLTEISHSIDAFNSFYLNIPSNQYLKLFLNIILKVNNKLNKESRKKEILNFDLSVLEYLCELKINAKSFLNIIMSAYESKLSSVIFEKNEVALLKSIINSQYPPSTVYKEFPKIKEEFIYAEEKLHSLVKNKICLCKFDEFLDELKIQIQALELKLKLEKEERISLLNYFNYELKEETSQHSTVQMIIQSLLTIANKTQQFFNEKINTSVENPEVSRRKSTIQKTKSSVTENKKKFNQSNNLLNIKYKLK